MRLVACALAVLAGCSTSAPYGHDAEIGALGGGKADGAVPHKKWTFMLYGAADNNLADNILHDVNELESVGSTEEINFLAFLDTPQGATVNYLLEDSDDSVLSSPSASWGTRDSGNVQTLIAFADWALESYPADRYALVISGHGGGSPRVIAPDFSTGSAIAVSDLETAAERITADSHRKLEVFGADACLMQTVEVTYELRDRASYIVASENTEPGTGWSYDFIGRELVKTPDVLGDFLSDVLVGSYARDYTNTGEGATLSALETIGLAAPPDPNHTIAGAMTALADTLVAHAATPAGHAELSTFASQVYRVYGSTDDYADLASLLALLQTSQSAVLRDAAARAEVAARDLIHVAWADPLLLPRPGGISIYFPYGATADGVAAYAQQYQFAKAVGWDRVVEAMR